MKKQLFFMSVVVLLQTVALLAPPTFSSAQTIAGGGNHSLAVCSDNTARAWGYNVSGQLGNGTNLNGYVPVQVSNLSGVIAVAGAEDFSLALKQDGSVWAWGVNPYGQLGNGITGGSSNIPVQVSNLSDVIAIAAGSVAHCLALKNDGTVWAWGRNNEGQLGNDSITESNVPIQVSDLSGVTAIAGGSYHSLAVKDDGTVWTWGYNLYGQLGNDTIVGNSNIPVQVVNLSGVIAIAGGGDLSIALKNDGTVWAWGRNTYGALGNGTNANSNIPLQVSNLSGAIAIAAGGYYSLALMNDSTVWTWGSNSHGQLGNANNNDSNVPVQVDNLSGIIVIAAGFQHALGVKNDGTVSAWGNNIYGSLGDGNSGTTSNFPVQVTGLCQVLTLVNEITEPLSISVYPNPSSGKFTLEVTGNKGQVTILEIHNVLGVPINTGMKQHLLNELDLSNFPKGIYFAKIYDREKIHTEKIVIQ